MTSGHVFPASFRRSTVGRLALAVSACGKADADGAATGPRSRPSEFVRLVEDDHGDPLALETAIVRCAPARSDQKHPTIDLIAAVHVADEAY